MPNGTSPVTNSTTRTSIPIFDLCSNTCGPCDRNEKPIPPRRTNIDNLTSYDTKGMGSMRFNRSPRSNASSPSAAELNQLTHWTSSEEDDNSTSMKNSPRHAQPKETFQLATMTARRPVKPPTLSPPQPTASRSSTKRCVPNSNKEQY